MSAVDDAIERTEEHRQTWASISPDHQHDQVALDRAVLAAEVRRLRSLVRQWSQAADMLQRDARVLEKEIERLRLEVISAEQVLAAFVEDSDDDSMGMVGSG